MDIVLSITAVALQSEDGDERDRRTVERDEPDAENLRNVDVEEEIWLIVCYSESLAS